MSKVRSVAITAIAIAAAAAAGIIAAVALLYDAPPTARNALGGNDVVAVQDSVSAAASDGAQQKPAAGGKAGTNATTNATTTTVTTPPAPVANTTAAPPSPTADYRKVDVTVNGFGLVADVADTNDRRSKGLAVRDSMAEDEGMLFVFNKPSQYSFWMKGMKFPIDIIWLDSDGRVVHVEGSLEPCPPVGRCPSYTPSADSLYVLETVAGFAEKHGVGKGTQVEFSLQ